MLAPVMAPPSEPARGSLFELLGVARDVSATALRRAFRSALTRLHPDKGGDAEALKAVQEAYAVLSDPQKVRDGGAVVLGGA